MFTLTDAAKWNENFQKLPREQQDIYFTPELYQLYEDLGDGKANCFVFEHEGDIAIYPFLLNSINELGYELDKEYFDIQGVYGYNGWLVSTMDESFIKELQRGFSTYCKKENIVAEFTRFYPLIENQKFSKNIMDVIYDRETVALDLHKSFEDIWQNEYSSTNKNMIRKAEKLGYEIEIINDPTKNEIEKFIVIYEYSMKMANAKEYYYFNNDFFLNTFKYLNNYTFLFNVKTKENEVVCSSIFFHYKDYFHYHLSGRSENADNSVNNFLLNEAVKFAQKKNAKVFHFGGGKTNLPDDSLLKFKSNFSKKRLSFYIGKKIYNEEIYNEVIRQWEEKVKINKMSTNNKLLRYREI